VGNFGFDLMGGSPVEATSLLCVGTDGCARVVAEGLGFPMAWRSLPMAAS
jgi:hypothetical protein